MTSHEMIWKHQLDEVSHALDPARALPWSPRSGKTKALVCSMKAAYEAYHFDRWLVIGTTLALHTQWADELADEWTEAIVINLAGGSVPARIALLSQIEAYKGPLVVLVNWEALDALNPAIDRFLRPEGVVADEAHNAKRPGAKRSVALHHWAKARWRRTATGTLTPKNYTDIYSQWKFLNPARFGTNQEKFRERYCIMDSRFPGRVKGYVRLDELHRLVALDATVIDRRTVRGAPHELDVPVTVPLPPAARKLYEQLARKHILLGVNYPNRMSRSLAKRQLTSGYQQLDGQVKWIHNAKIEACEQNAQEFFEAQEPLVIFYQWDPEGDRLQSALQPRLVGTFARVDGNVSIKRRIEIQRAFQRGDLSTVLWQEQTDTQGISLSAADACLFYSHSYNFGTVKQARDRIWKDAGMLRYLYLRCPNTVDDDVWDNVINKQGSSERFEQGVMSAGF